MSILASIGLDKLGAGLADAGLGWITGQESARAARRAQQKWDSRIIQTRVADAKKAGIHPLAALGVPMGSGPSFSVGANPGTPFQNALNRDGSPYQRGLSDKRAYYETEILASQAQSAAAQAQMDKLQAAQQANEVVTGLPGSRGNPKRGLIRYEIERPDGSVVTIPAPASELAEGGEGAIGSKLFYGSNIDWKTYKQLFPAESDSGGMFNWFK